MTANLFLLASEERDLVLFKCRKVRDARKLSGRVGDTARFLGGTDA